MPSTPTGQEPSEQPFHTPPTPEPLGPELTPDPLAAKALGPGLVTPGRSFGTPPPIQTPSAPGQLTSDQLFDLIKQYEGLIPIPAPYVNLNVGTFNAATGAWSGFTTRVITDPEPVEHEPGQHPTSPAPRFVGSEYISTVIDAQWRRTTTITPAPKVVIAPVLLQFEVTNASGPWSVTIDGFTLTAPAGQTTLNVSAWDRTIVQWSIQAGGQSHSDRFLIQRPAGVPAFGAFTIPVIPVAIVYAPPADSQQLSTASYNSTDTVGTTISWDLSTDTSQTTEPAFTDGSAFRALLSVVSTALGVAGSATTEGATTDAEKADGAALSTSSSNITSIAALFPSDNISQQSGQVTDNGGSLTVTFSQSSTLGTTAKGGGPGVGDNIIFYKDVRVAWAYAGGQWLLCPFGWTVVTATAASVQNQATQLGIAPEDQQALLALDPFVAGGAFATPPGDRFTVPQGVEASIEYGGGTSYDQKYTQTRDTKDTTTTKTYTTDTDSWSPGTILQMFGVGATKSQTTTTVTNATGTEVSDSVTLDANLVSGPSDVFAVAIWYDNLFGTWAFQQLPTGGAAALTGQGAQPGQPVRLEVGGRVHVAIADQKGDYTFRAPNIAHGVGQLMISGKPPTAVQIGPLGGPGHGIVDHPPGGGAPPTRRL